MIFTGKAMRAPLRFVEELQHGISGERQLIALCCSVEGEMTCTPQCRAERRHCQRSEWLVLLHPASSNPADPMSSCRNFRSSSDKGRRTGAAKCRLRREFV
jgi:hypothetical protein